MPEEPKQNGASETLEKGAKAAHAVRGAVKTGKAIAGAAKGAAVGGPYGAVAAALWQNRKTVAKAMAAVGFLLFLPVLFVLMLPSMIFGGLDTGTGSVPILNDNSAIMENIAQADTVIRTALSDSHTAVLSQIQEDVKSLEAGMEHQIIDPYTETLPFDSSLIISQYCVANSSYKAVNLADFQLKVEMSKEHLFTFHKEIRVEPIVQDGEVVGERPIAVYTVQYAGEDYFGDTVFALNEEQKTYARNYAENLEMFLHDPLLSVSYETGVNDHAG